MRLWLAAGIGVAILTIDASPSLSAETAVAPALCASIDRNIAHAQGWLEADDFKSLAQAAGGLELLAAVLKSQSDDGQWQAAADRVQKAAQTVMSTAQSQDAAAARDALTTLAAATAAMAKLRPAGQPLPPPKANLRSVMLLMDGMRGEAKIALIAGNAEKAKNQAHVLSELGRVVSNLRSGERWARLAGDFTEASLAAARSPAADSAELRPLLKAVSLRCDACHDNR
jgi:hypothetical protein